MSVVVNGKTYTDEQVKAAIELVEHTMHVREMYSEVFAIEKKSKSLGYETQHEYAAAQDRHKQLTDEVLKSVMTQNNIENRWKAATKAAAG